MSVFRRSRNSPFPLIFPGRLESINSPRRYEPTGITMRLFCVIGNDVCRYTESPGLALRVEIPFSSTTPMRVPAGTKIFSFDLALCSIVGGGEGATGGGADVCGPSGCLADKLAENRSTLTPSNAVAIATPFGL